MNTDRATRVRWRDRPPFQGGPEWKRLQARMDRERERQEREKASAREAYKAREAARRAEPPMPGRQVALWAVGFYLFVLIVAPLVFSIMTGVSTCNPHYTSGVAPMVEVDQ